jgi:hypothetical protein
MPIFRFDVRVRMRDGVRLSTNILLPDGGGPFPTVLIRSPYNVHGMISFLKALVPHLGIAWVLQDTRGRYNSEGDAFRSSERPRSVPCSPPPHSPGPRRASSTGTASSTSTGPYPGAS